MRIKRDVNWTQVKENYFLTHMKDDVRFFHEVNSTGSLIWEGLREGLEVDEIAKNIMAEYEVEKSQVLADINEFCIFLKDLGLIEDV